MDYKEWNIMDGWHYAAILCEENTDVLRIIDHMMYALDRTSCEEQQFSGPAYIQVDEDTWGWAMIGIGRPRLPGA